MAWWNLSRRKTSLEAEIELRASLPHQRADQRKDRAGLTPEQARREAILEFGGNEQVKEEVRDVHRIATVENTFANLKSGIRLLRKSPSFSAAVILTLALAIGANSAVFSAINAILLRPLPFPNSGELVMLLQSNRKATAEPSAVAAIRLEDWNRLNGAFQAISGWYTEDVSEVSGVSAGESKGGDGGPAVSSSLGRRAGARPGFRSRRRALSADPMPSLISDRFWRRRFHRGP